MRTRSIRGPAIASAVALALIGAGTMPAMAAEDPVEATADLIAEVAPDQGDIVDDVVVEDGRVQVDTADLVASIPVDPEEPVVLGSSTPQESGQALEIC